MNQLDEFVEMYNNSTTESKIFEFIYGCAMHDAVIQLAFTGSKRWVGQVDGAKNAVKEYIDNIIAGSFHDQHDHDISFFKTAKSVCNEINSYAEKPSSATDRFTFGNAQKLINMAVKHCYIMRYRNISLVDKFRYCHCPLDSRMLKKIWDLYIEVEDCNKLQRKQNLGSDFLASWGHEDFKDDCNDFPERYNKYQTIIRKWSERIGCIPIEFDYYVWGT